MNKKVIFNADDFGLNQAVNAGIEEAIEAGRITSASLLPNGPATDQAITIAQVHEFPVGIHLNLLHEAPISPRESVPSLVHEEGRMPAGYKAFLRGRLRGRIHFEDVAREFRHQIQKISARDIEVDHLDSHQHLHLFPDLISTVAGLARRNGINRIRTADELIRRTFDALSLPLLGLKGLSKYGKSILRNEGLLTNDQFVGVSLRNAFTEETFDSFLSDLNPGVTEVGLHIGKRTSGASRHIRKERDWEGMLNFILSDTFQELIEEHEVQTIGWDELSEPDSSS